VFSVSLRSIRSVFLMLGYACGIHPWCRLIVRWKVLPHLICRQDLVHSSALPQFSLLIEQVFVKFLFHKFARGFFQSQSYIPEDRVVLMLVSTAKVLESAPLTGQ
jgi:hypothetical protein